MTMLSVFESRAFRARVIAAFAAMLALGSGAALAQDVEDEESD